MTTLTRTDSRENCPFSGIAHRVFGVGCITFNGSIIKLVVNEHSIGQGVFIRGVLVLLLISQLVIRHGVFNILRYILGACSFGRYLRMNTAYASCGECPSPFDLLHCDGVLGYLSFFTLEW